MNLVLGVKTTVHSWIYINQVGSSYMPYSWTKAPRYPSEMKESRVSKCQVETADLYKGYVCNDCAKQLSSHLLLCREVIIRLHLCISWYYTRQSQGSNTYQGQVHAWSKLGRTRCYTSQLSLDNDLCQWGQSFTIENALRSWQIPQQARTDSTSSVMTHLWSETYVQQTITSTPLFHRHHP